MNLEDGENGGNVSAGKAIDALEAVMNILFLAAQKAKDGSEVQKLLRDAEPCVITLARFLKEQRVRTDKWAT